jgi:CheY-like chemotaxis protein
VPLCRPRSRRRPPRGSDRSAFLIIDDEPELAGILVEAFERDGHRADTARNGAEALQLLRRHEYDLVVSDTKMPIMDGVTFYRELERRFPYLKERILFVTGDVLDPEKRHFLETTRAPFLAKPFDLGDVRRTVRELLA